MKKLFIAIFTLSFMLLGIMQVVNATNSSTTGVNLLTNPSFENWTNGNPDGWTIPANATHAGSLTWTQETGIKTNGASALKLAVGTTQNPGFQQVVPITAGKTYTLKVDYYVVSGDGTDVRIWSTFKNAAGFYGATNWTTAVTADPNIQKKLQGSGSDTGAYFTAVNNNWYTYTVDFVAPADATDFAFECRTYKSCTAIWDNLYLGEFVSEISTSTNELTGFQYAPGNGPSAQQQFTIGGTGLSSGITVTAPTNYEISALSGNDFVGTSSMNIPASSGSVSPLTLYVRLKSGLAENTYTGNITVSSTGLTTKNIALTGKVEAPPSIVTLSTDVLDNFQYLYGSGPSAEKTFTLNGSGLTSGVSISVPSSFEISALSGMSFTGTNSITIPHTNGNISNLTLYVRLKAGLTVNTYIGNITFTTNGSATKTIAVSGSVDTAPVVINKSTTWLNGFTYNFGNGPSNTQTFTIDGTGFTADVVLTAPENYELSSNFGVSFSNSVSFTSSGGALSSKTIYVRLKSGLSASTYSGSITIASAGATNQSISLNGSVTLPAGISISTTSLSGFDYVAESGPSAIKSFVVYGGSLTSMIIVTAPADFEISTTDGVSFLGSGQILLQHSNGLVNAVTIYVRLKAGLDVNSYSGSITLSSSGQTSKSIELSGSVTMPTNTKQDFSFYEPKNSGKLIFKNMWICSTKIGNYTTTDELIAPSGTARGMAVKDGKMLFIDRQNKQIVRVSGSTGAKLTSLSLASNLFTYLGRNKANTADSTWTAGALGFNDIKVDNAGNVLLGNLTTNMNTSTQRFQIWKINMNDGTGTLVIDQSNLATLFPSATTLRFDYFNVLGDVNNNAIILAANSSALEVYKWIITNGVASDPTVIQLDNSVATGKDLSGLANLGTAPQVFPVDNNKFYVDGNATYPVLCDMNGNVLDGFKSNLNNLKDSTTMPGAMLYMNAGHNGMKEFQVGNEHFIVMAATNTVGYPESTFRLFKFADANKSFATMDCLWTFPLDGMGIKSNTYRTAMPTVEVSGNTAKIYIYVGENGYGMYELITDGKWTGNDTKMADNKKVNVMYANKKLMFSEIVKRFEVFNVAGQLIINQNNISEANVNLDKGVYIVSFITDAGLKQSEKIIVK